MSQRVGIIGVGESGKSSLCRKLVSEAGIPYYVRDPIMSHWEGAALVTPDMPEFIEAVENLDFPRIAVIDEAGDVLKVGDYENHKCFTRWRHNAILPIAIAQRYKMIAPNVRVNFTDVYLFETALPDCEQLAIDFNCSELLDAANFEAGEFFHYRRVNNKKVLTKHRLW
jgi:hypothetical protein